MSSQAPTHPFTVRIDGQPVEVEPETTIKQAAEQLGINIPTLCYHPAIEPYGSCRVCTVELKRGQRVRMVTACNYPLREEGVEIFTRSERALRSRRLVLELLLARCPEVKLIRDLAGEVGLTESRYPREEGKASERCILCGLCVNVCAQVVKASAIDFVGRGVSLKVAPPFLTQSQACIGCGACAYVCPTGAVTLEDVGKFRKLEIWQAEIEMSACIRCGKPVASPQHIQEILGRLNLAQEYIGVCPACRSREYARQNLLTQGVAERI